MKTDAEQFDDSMSADESDAACKATDRAATMLAEHFDSVRIIATRFNVKTQETQSYTTGKGNFYAQVQSARDWVTKQDECVRIHTRRENE